MLQNVYDHIVHFQNDCLIVADEARSTTISPFLNFEVVYAMKHLLCCAAKHC